MLSNLVHESGELSSLVHLVESYEVTNLRKKYSRIDNPPPFLKSFLHRNVVQFDVYFNGTFNNKLFILLVHTKR